MMAFTSSASRYSGIRFWRFATCAGLCFGVTAMIPYGPSGIGSGLHPSTSAEGLAVKGVSMRGSGQTAVDQEADIRCSAAPCAIANTRWSASRTICCPSPAEGAWLQQKGGP